jgi:hypothetical protein
MCFLCNCMIGGQVIVLKAVSYNVERPECQVSGPLDATIAKFSICRAFYFFEEGIECLIFAHIQPMKVEDVIQCFGRNAAGNRLLADVALKQQPIWCHNDGSRNDIQPNTHKPNLAPRMIA